MSDFIGRLTGRKRKSAYQAKERLQLVLIHDRTNLSSTVLEKMKDEIIEVISRHIEIEPDTVSIELNKDGREQRLIADIPVLGPKKKR
ncbi:MAG: cell division topological specificity factor MinE [Anaerolineales bacterium]|nr:cell division topological specificity factor MinE [Chloroflexota bacterium]MBL6981367.1 cell division topological specificity factor MinE [Anaerolineales bacterium]